ncbi:hypothetical protein FACS1894110_13160 [Spirochaetia bacterium]|nr:hypothetical protein FACS1894110_13160 [Spirochaetia bacterium]
MPDCIVLIICIAGIGFFLRLFWNDMYRTLTRGNEIPVGTITWKEKEAQRRFSDRVLWGRLQIKTPIYDGDFIRTADLSGATITFTGGEEINLSENTLIQILREGSKPRVDFVQGNVSLNAANGTGEGITFSSGNTNLDIASGAVVNIGAANNGNLNLQVSEGTATVNGLQAGAGSAYSVDGSGALGTITMAAVTSPRPDARYLNQSRDSLTVPFTWNRINYGENEKTRLEIAGDRSFTRIAVSEELNESSITVNMENGTWWWRVYPVSTVDNAATGRLSIIYSAPPVLTAPAEGYLYRYRTKPSSVRFQWTETAEASYYLLEAADNREFRNPALQTQAQGTSFIYAKLNPGRWYWRVQPVFTGNYTGRAEVSEIRSFVIEQNDTLSAPTLQGPTNGNSVNTARNAPGVYFSWKNEEEANTYTIRISPNQNLSNPVVSETVSTNFYVYQPSTARLRPGQYYWAVHQTAADGSNSPASAVYQFSSVEGAVVNDESQRTIFPPDNYTIAENLLPDTWFTWNSNLPNRIRFQVSSSADFSSPVIDRVVTGSPAQGSRLPLGTWYWRIAAVGDNGALLSGPQYQTAAKRFSVVSPTLPQPVLETPRSGGRAFIRLDNQVEFRWQAVTGADQYLFRLYRGTAQGQPLFETTLNRATSQIVDWSRYGEGAYSWTLQAMAAETNLQSRRSGLAAAANFTARKLQLISLDSPARNAAIDGLTALRQPGTVRWSSNETVRNSRFVLSKNANPLVGTPLMDISNPGRSIPLIKLEAGTYYWTIRAETAEGVDLSPAEAASFRVLPFRITPVRLDQDATEISGLDAFRKPTIVRWSTNETVGTSRFVLSKNANPLQGTPVTAINNPGREIRLTKLEPGEYYWTVRVETRDGFDISPETPLRFLVLPLQIARVQPEQGAAEIPGLDALRRPGTVKWSSNEPVGTSRFILSQNPNPLAGTPLMDIPNPGKTINLIGLREGTYYWTIQAQTADGIDISPAAPATFRVLPVQLAPIQLNQGPSEISGLDALRRPGTVSWSTDERVGTSRFVLSQNPNPLLGEPLMDIKNPGKTVNLISLPVGTYYWTVQGETTDGIDISAWTPATFRVTPFELGPIRLEQGAAEIAGLEAFRRPGTVKWSTDEKVGNSRFVLSKNPDPLTGTPLMDIKNPDKTVRLISLGEGTYYWTIQAETDDGVNISARVPATFRVLPLQIAPIRLEQGAAEIAGLDAYRKPITVQWNTYEMVGNSRFVLSRNPNPLVGEPLMDIRNPGKTINLIKLEEGTYYWTVQVVTSDGIDITPAAPASFRVLPLQITPIRLEQDAAEISGINAFRKPITVRWSTGETVGTSRFILSKNANPLQGTPVISTNNPDKEIRFTKLAPGDYYWTIQAKTADGLDISARAPLRFRVTPLQIAPVQLAQNTEIPGLDAFRQQGTVRWSSTETVGNSRFVLSRNPNPLVGEPLMDIRNPDKTINLIKLLEGTYYWTVQAITSDGIDITPAAPASFRVLPLQITPIRLEQDAAEISGLDAFRRPIVLRWSTGETVAASTFILSQNATPIQLLYPGGTGGTPSQILNNPGNEIRLTRLGPGDYYWTIHATTDDGLDISPPAPAHFRVLPMDLDPVQME